MRYRQRSSPVPTIVVLAFVLGMLFLGCAWLNNLGHYVPHVPCPPEYIQHCHIPECRVDTE